MSDFQSYNSNIDNPFSSLYTPIDNINTSGQSSATQSSATQSSATQSSATQSSATQMSASQMSASQMSAQQDIRTPSIPYNYMPRQRYTSSPYELQSYTPNSKLTIYNENNYEKPVDRNFHATFFDFSNPNSAGTSFIPTDSQSTIIG